MIALISAAVPPTDSSTDQPTTVPTSRPLAYSGQRTVPPPSGRVAPSSTITSATRPHSTPAATQDSSEAGPAVWAANIAANSQPEPRMLENPIAARLQKPSSLRSRRSSLSAVGTSAAGRGSFCGTCAPLLTGAGGNAGPSVSRRAPLTAKDRPAAGPAHRPVAPPARPGGLAPGARTPPGAVNGKQRRPAAPSSWSAMSTPPATPAPAGVPPAAGRAG